MRFTVGQRVTFRDSNGGRCFGYVAGATGTRLVIINDLDWDGRPMAYELDIGPAYSIRSDDGHRLELGESELEAM